MKDMKTPIANLLNAYASLKAAKSAQVDDAALQSSCTELTTAMTKYEDGWKQCKRVMPKAAKAKAKPAAKAQA